MKFIAMTECELGFADSGKAICHPGVVSRAIEQMGEGAREFLLSASTPERSARRAARVLSKSAR